MVHGKYVNTVKSGIKETGFYIKLEAILVVASDSDNQTECSIDW